MISKNTDTPVHLYLLSFLSFFFSCKCNDIAINLTEGVMSFIKHFISSQSKLGLQKIMFKKALRVCVTLLLLACSFYVLFL